MGRLTGEAREIESSGRRGGVRLTLWDPGRSLFFAFESAVQAHNTSTVHLCLKPACE